MRYTKHDSLIGAKIGNITILSHIASGGMGAVYKAQHTNLGTYYAVKFFTPQKGEDLYTQSDAQLFRNEAMILSQLKNKHIVTIYDFGEFQSQLYIVMEYVKGDTLKGLLHRRGRLPFEEAISLTRQITEGLIAIHEKGVIHKDIKPSNILLDEDGTVILTDFGIAHSSDYSSKISQDIVKGSAGYMSPEQARGELLDARSDLYSLGILLYQILVGKKAYNHKDGALQTVITQLQQDIPNLQLFLPDIPIELLFIIRKLTNRDVEQRFANGLLLLRALDSIVVGSVPSTTTHSRLPETDTFTIPTVSLHPSCQEIQEVFAEFVGPLAPHIFKSVLYNKGLSIDSCDDDQHGLILHELGKKLGRKRNELFKKVLKERLS